MAAATAPSSASLTGPPGGVPNPGPDKVPRVGVCALVFCLRISPRGSSPGGRPYSPRHFPESVVGSWPVAIWKCCSPLELLGAHAPGRGVAAPLSVTQRYQREKVPVSQVGPEQGGSCYRP